jgi:hypothetical protein
MAARRAWAATGNLHSICDQREQDRQIPVPGCFAKMLIQQAAASEQIAEFIRPDRDRE